MSGARERILERLRAVCIEGKPLPPVVPLAEASSEAASEKSIARFSAALAAAGGRAERVLRSALPDRLRAAARERPGAVVASTSSAYEGNVDPSTIATPHALETVELAIVPGAFGVAENGAVWVPDADLRHRALLFLTQHLFLVVDASNLVDDMHAAYARLDLTRPGFGCFIAGPSKTADIEQALVIGAHGARSTTVLLCEDDR